MNIKKMSIRLRLTFAYAVGLLLILGVLSTSVYFFMKNQIQSMSREQLESGYEVVENVIMISQGDMYDVVHLGQRSLFTILKEGDVIYQTEAWQHTGLPQPPEGHKNAVSPAYSWKSPEGRIFSFQRGTIPEYNMELVFAQDVTAVHETIAAYRNISLAVVPGAIILALLGGYVLSRRALSPVEEITRKAKQITAESLSERLPVRNPNDEIGRLAFVFNQTLERLESSFDRLTRFTADASHELRTPLTSMRSVGEVTLQKNNGIQSYREAISSILEEIDRLTQLADNLLLLTRQDAGKTAADRKPVNAAGAVNEVIEELRVLAEDKNQSLKLEKEKPLAVLADPSLLRQALVNVIHNAVRYTQAGGEIKVRLSQNDHQQAVIDIIDNGPGIPKTERIKVFERFYRYDKGRASKQGGGGLGLAIAKQAITANHGTIAFLDAPGPGAWCRVTLPLA